LDRLKGLPPTRSGWYQPQTQPQPQIIYQPIVVYPSYGYSGGLGGYYPLRPRGNYGVLGLWW
jgi:hypothetical protein